MKKYLKSTKLIALVLMVIIALSGCGALNAANQLMNNQNNGTVAPTNPPAGDVVYDLPNYGEDITYSAVISNPDATTPATGTNNTVTGGSASANSSEGTTLSSGKNTQNAQKPSADSSGSSATNKAPTTQKNNNSNTQTTTQEKPSSNETTKPNYHEDGDYLANVQDVLFNTDDPTVARNVLVAAGFDYDPVQDVYYTQLDSWQRNFGFNSVYDTAAPMVGMIYSSSKIYFTYDDKDWMMEIWKGQYGITSGGEIGFYNKPTDRVMKHFDCVTDEEMITMSFDFYNMGEKVFTRGPEKHWWLTGFKFLHAGVPMFIELDITVEFPNRKMANAFEAGLKEECKKQLLDSMEYTRTGDSFNIVW
ncbi:MAG: DUF4474 domain-containing protein [Clostridia bacterium]|nr:DUF4474 domain-containing protein [Clostridia bacterium]